MVKFLPGGQVLGVIIVLCFLLAIFWWTPTGLHAGYAQPVRVVV